LKRFFILTISILAGLYSYNQDIDETFEFGNNQRKAGNYDNAIEAYRKVLFFDSSGVYSFKASVNLSVCYLEEDEFNKSQYYTDLAYALCDNDSIKNELIFQKAANFIEYEYYDQALIELLNLDRLTSEYFENKKNFYLGVVYFQKKNFNSSNEHFNNCIDTIYIAEKQKLSHLFSEINHVYRRYNPKFAWTLSLIIPGLGQIYCGDIKSGLNSLILTGALGFLFINTAINYTLLDAFISVGPWYQRYYQGGFQNAERAAIQRREKEIALIYSGIMDIFEGIIPFK
jgi:tetratricopeptide (TPR) repeat protein